MTIACLKAGTSCDWLLLFENQEVVKRELRRQILHITDRFHTLQAMSGNTFISMICSRIE